MKIVIVSGSRRNGNTLAIANIYAGLFKSEGFEVSVVNLENYKFELCDGCLMCDETQTCKYNDGFNEVIDEIRSSNLLILGCPTRWGLLSGELKCFLDRMNPYAAIEGYNDLNAFVYSVGQCSIEDGESILNAIKSIIDFTCDAGMKLLGSQAFYGLLEEDAVNKEGNEIVKKCKKNVDELMGKLIL